MLGGEMMKSKVKVVYVAAKDFTDEQLKRFKLPNKGTFAIMFVPDGGFLEFLQGMVKK
jgi:hypothetical protein